MANFRREKKPYGKWKLTRDQYWATVKLNDGTVIRVIKSKKKVYQKGF